MTDPNKDLDSPQHQADSSEIDWDAAMAEQLGAEAAKEDKSTATQADGLKSNDGENTAAATENAESTANPDASDTSSAEDDWAAALAEQTAGTAAQQHSADAKADRQVQEAGHQLFKPLRGSDATADSDIDMIMDIPVQLTVELGRTRLTIKNILQLGQGSVVELDGLAGEPMDIFVNGYLIAQGEVVVVDEKYGIRVTDIITPSDRIQRLNGRR